MSERRSAHEPPDIPASAGLVLVQSEDFPYVSCLNEGPVRLVTKQDLRTMTAGTTFIGQVLEHDITFDNTAKFGVVKPSPLRPPTRVSRSSSFAAA